MTGHSAPRRVHQALRACKPGTEDEFVLTRGIARVGAIRKVAKRMSDLRESMTER